MKKILLLSDIDLPDSCALAVRVITFAKLFTATGSDVFLLGTTSDKKKAETTQSLYGFKTKFIFCEQTNGLKSIGRIRKIKKEISAFLAMNRNLFDAIFLSNIYYDYADLFIKFSKKNKTPIIINSVEWYDKSDPGFKGVFGLLKLFKNRIALKHFFPRFKNIIAISSLLASYYNRKKCHVIRIPTILDMNDYANTAHRMTDKVIVSYAGSPAKKDIITSAIISMKNLDSSKKNKVEMHFYGTNENDVVSMGLTKNYLLSLENVYFHGRIKQIEVKNIISSSDFTFLIRPNKRYANAGFPTKIGESFACGTPVIANITSDLSLYLKDGENSIIAKGTDVQFFEEALLKAIQLNKSDIQLMRDRAKTTALKSFDYNNYIDSIKEFLNNLVCVK